MLYQTKTKMKSVNQKYRESGSDMSFRDWLNSQAEQGAIKKKSEPNEMQFSANGGTSVQLFGIDAKYLLIGTILLVGGYIAYKKFKK
jgi:hypothetical protein